MKVVKTAVEIKHGLKDNLELGNLQVCRDWGFAGDYVKAMWMMLQHKEPDDFVIATGITRNVLGLVQTTFELLGLDYNKYLTINPKYIRPDELYNLKGDYSKAYNILGWEPEVSFEEMIQDMIDSCEKKFNANTKTKNIHMA